ncbi:MAG: hypothetical protein LBG48_02265 [Rickettsiales bacterium]|jgi:kynurenine formamidase|nr:hypothetical protein [Rickettsiales bacterium]
MDNNDINSNKCDDNSSSTSAYDSKIADNFGIDRGRCFKTLEIKSIQNNESDEKIYAATFGKEVREIDEDKLGLIFPVVTFHKDNWIVLNGQKLIEAAKFRMLNNIDVIVINTFGDRDIAKTRLFYLSQEKEKIPIIIAKAIQEGINAGIDRQSIGSILRINKGTISKYLALINETPIVIQEKVASKDLKIRSALAIADLPKNLQVGFACKVIESQITCKNVENIVKKYNTIQEDTQERRLMLDDPLHYLENEAKKRGSTPEKPRKKRGEIALFELLIIINNIIHFLTIAINKCKQARGPHLQNFPRDKMMLLQNLFMTLINDIQYVSDEEEIP